jgi:hypothetical protein
MATAQTQVQPQTQVQYVQRPAPQVQIVEVPVSPPKQVQYVQVQRPAPQVQYVQQPVQQSVQYVVAPQPVRQRGRRAERTSPRGKVSEGASKHERRADWQVVWWFIGSEADTADYEL